MGRLARMVPTLAAVALLLAAPSGAQDVPPSEGDVGCSCTGVDYTNGGSYLIDGSANLNFTFTSVFSGKSVYSSCSIPEAQLQSL
jgi:hypothetical protein